MNNFEDRLKACSVIGDKKQRSACLWNLIFDLEVFIDDVRRHIPYGTAIEPIASAIVERCVDISREIAKGMKSNDVDIIDWGYINEKERRLERDIEDMKHDIKVFRIRNEPQQITY